MATKKTASKGSRADRRKTPGTIKGAAGMTMAQAPESAKYSGRPSSAIATVLVDYVLPGMILPAVEEVKAPRRRGTGEAQQKEPSP